MAENNGINAITLAISWVLSTITTLLILGIIYLINRCRRAQRRKRDMDGGLRKLEDLRQSQRSSMSNTTTATQSSAIPLVNNNESGSIYKPIRQTSRQLSLESDLNRVEQQQQPSRRIRDYVLKWCSENGLPETVAVTLREHGFMTKEYLDALKPEDVPTLGLHNKAMECRLREVLQAKESSKERQSSTSSVSSNAQPIQHPVKPRRRSGSDDRKPVSPHHGTDPGSAQPLLNRFQSAEPVEDPNEMASQTSGYAKKKKVPTATLR